MSDDAVDAIKYGLVLFSTAKTIDIALAAYDCAISGDLRAQLFWLRNRERK